MLRRALLVSLLLVPVLAFGQSADQQVVSVVDSPDPVTPGSSLTYTITVTNHGPDAAVNGGFNTNLPGQVTYQGTVAPAGFTCSTFGAAVSCTNPSFAPGTAVFTMTVLVNASLANFPDGSFTTTFSPSGTTPDPNNGNNNASATTNYDSAQVDLYLSVTDNPDPVNPDGTITYTVPVTNGGPDTASNVNFNVVPNSSLRFSSATVPAGWTCTLPSVGAQNATFTCSRPSFAVGTDNFIVVFTANDETIGINDTTLQSNFNVNTAGSNETDNSDNSETESTAYVAPDADVTVSVTDSPDPVFPDGNITYTVTVGNTGPDPAPNITLSSFGSNNLRFVSATVPAGWNCTLPASGAQTAGFSCTLAAGLASGSNSVLTFVLQATDELIGINDTTIQFGFGANSTVFDPDDDDNSETESTAYVTPDAGIVVTASDSPDPVGPDGDITYSVSVQNTGPDAAPNVTLNVPMNNTLRFQSVSAPGAWTCSPPAVGAGTSWSCTIASLPVQPASLFTIVLRANDEQFGIIDQTIVQNFNAASAVFDPDPDDNSVNVSTQYVTPDANLSVTNTDAPDPVAPGATITWTQTITNAGPDAAPNATLSQVLPASVGFQSIVPGTGFTCTTPAAGASGAINCTNPSLASGVTGTFTLTATVLASSGTVTLTATASSNVFDPDNTYDSATAITTITPTPEADLRVTKTASRTTAPSGSTITYTITITNLGPDTATAVTMTDTLPADQLFQSLNPAAGFTCTTPAAGANGTANCTGGTLADDQSAVFTLVVTSNATSGNATNTATAGSAAFDSNSSNSTNDSPPVTYAPASADVSINKTTAATSASEGDTLFYTITVTNGGPSPATNVVVTDTLPAGLSLVLVAPSQGTCNAASPVTCNLGTLADGASATITLQTTVTATSGTITNSASVSATEDGASGNNTSTTAPLAVVPAPGSGEPIPTLSEWMLLALMAMLALAAALRMRT